MGKLQIIFAVTAFVIIGAIAIAAGLEEYGFFGALLAAIFTPSEETLKKWFS